MRAIHPRAELVELLLTVLMLLSAGCMACEKIPIGDDSPDPDAPLKTVEVCAYSGHLPTPDCPHRKAALAQRERVPTERCPYHVGVDVDLDTGHALNPTCRAGRRWERRSYRSFPLRLSRW